MEWACLWQDKLYVNIPLWPDDETYTIIKLGVVSPLTVVVTWLTNCLASCLLALLQMVDLVVEIGELEFSFQMEWGSTSLAEGSARKC